MAEKQKKNPWRDAPGIGKAQAEPIATSSLTGNYGDKPQLANRASQQETMASALRDAEAGRMTDVPKRKKRAAY